MPVKYNDEGLKEVFTGDPQVSTETIIPMLESLPDITARPGFDQKMAALFALELESETILLNREAISESKNPV